MSTFIVYIQVIDQAVATLVKARQALNGKVTDLTALSMKFLKKLM
ncbi:hypothetical protein SDSE_0606 [Streptococcus dysgalactiae subsp. equisimilis AC-2713]|uniref:Uncharacterized protein n=1 Tax=Streptococcus dysgalactiae subsp. equisimilis AC-2713 TaxID=759913 RepID=A0AB33R3Y2_STREQ|nr:hypothetical protein [Streptococcus dysgalactiae]ADX24108.1 hypothetical protein SDE12394_02910 [Streptococcus dysgalactiae subsp. equisimilis ATCC 12394]EGL49593.1 hypothetical protein HMPREF9964_1722 [Streptococcus dysgalactiae subsp. equisimilis SK1249]CCI62104.1 hypothetical protein SDSE_0606 [Streptococcus dysgalactiae subsp. equisimilis AC-2713]